MTLDILCDSIESITSIVIPMNYCTLDEFKIVKRTR